MQTEDHIKAQLMDAADLDRTLSRMAREVTEVFEPSTLSASNLALVGMQTRGVYLARRLHRKIREAENTSVNFGILDATLYRDDVRKRLHQPLVRRTEILFDVNNAHIVLVDDVLFTGRTVRAALDALLDLGRPSTIRLLVLVDRGLRELPLQADIVGRFVPTTLGEEVRVKLQEYDKEEGVWLVNVPSHKRKNGNNPDFGQRVHKH
ncbi:MAG TPA: bifunctional pyr operon transcriptional regulator/uracil phosphoribosyltransferase PyrR [Bacteroidetes bacterium]|nr:bifunctional pyr operon transcriptional regulator/uracil phosphoribosyltransferase PyrR [Bacteroidota bacterium]